MKHISRTLLTAAVCLIIIGSIFLIYPNSRSSILIKEEVTVIGAVLVFLVLFVHTLSGKKISLNRLSLPLVLTFTLIVGWMIFRYYAGIQSVNGPKTMFNFVACGGIALAMVLVFNRTSRNAVLWTLAISTAILSVYSILQSMGIVIFSWDSGLIQQARSSGTMGNANLLGSFTAAMLPVGTGFLLGRSQLSKFRIPSAIAFSLICTGALIASKTRGSLIGIAVLIVLVPFLPAIRRNRKRLLAVLLLLLVLISGAVMMMQNRMQELVNTDDLGTFQVRKLIWSGTLSIVAENPVLGWGPGSFQILFPRFRNPEYFLLGVSHNTLHAHCEYLEILVDGGVVALLLFGALAFFLYRKFREIDFNNDDDEQKIGEDWTVYGIIGGIIALLAEATVSVALRWPISSLLFALLIGLALSSVKPSWKSIKGIRRVVFSVLFLACAIILGLIAVPNYSGSMKAGRQLFLGKDVYLARIQPNIENAVNAAAAWGRYGTHDEMDRALYYYDYAANMADSSVLWCERSVETSPGELGGWYALGSAYISRGMLYRPLSGQMISILQQNGRIPYDHDYSVENVIQGLRAYDSLMTRAPYYAEVHHNLALVWTNLGNTDSVLASIRTAWGLHAHNREDYLKQTDLLGVLSESVNANYIHMLGQITAIQSDYAIFSPEKYEMYHRQIIFYTGTSFLRHPEMADSLFSMFVGMADSIIPDHSSDLIEDMTIQISELEAELRVMELLRGSNMDGMLAELEDTNDRQMDILPAHSVASGLLRLQMKETSGAEDLCQIMTLLIRGSFDNFVAWPVNPSEIQRKIDSFLFEIGVESPEMQDLFIRNQVNSLLLDRKLFDTWSLVSATPEFRDNVPPYIQDYLSLVWGDIGGPLYSFSASSSIPDSVCPLFAPGSQLCSAFQGLEMLREESPENANLVKLEIAWFYVLFQSFYFGVPSVSQEQIDYVIDRLSLLRMELVDLVGEDEVRYQLGFMFENWLSRQSMRIGEDYQPYIEMLKSDLMMGRL